MKKLIALALLLVSPSLAHAQSTAHAEDSAHVSGAFGSFVLCVRKDTATQLAGTDGDYSPCITDASGRMWINLGGWLGSTAPTVGQKTMANSIPFVLASDQPAVPISGTVTANAGTNLNTSALALETSLAKLTLLQGSTTSGQSGTLAQGAVTTGAPTYTTGQTSPLSLTTAGELRVAGSFSGGGDGAIQDGASPSIEATVRDYTNANPLAVTLTDTNGDPASVGGGTQYNQGTATTDTDTLTLAGAVRRDTAAVATGVVDGDRLALSTDNAGRLRVNSADTTQPVSGTVTANAGTGTFAVSAASLPLPAGAATSANQDGIIRDGTGDTTQANVSGGRLQVDVNNVSGTVSLPTGAATSANQTTQITALQLIDNLPNTIGSTTSGQSGALALGAVTTSAPTYTTAQSHPLSLDTTGALRVNVTAGPGGGTSQADNSAVTSITGAGALYDTTPPTITDGNVGLPRMNANRRLQVDVAEVTAAGQTDRSTFTDGTDPVTPIAGVYNETNTNPTEDQAAVARITVERALHTNLRDATGDIGSTVFDLTNSNPLATQIVDANGSAITSFGGGTQYAEDTTHVTGDTMTLAGVVQKTADGALSTDGDRSLLQVDENGMLKVNIKGGAISGVDEGTFTPATSIGAPMMGATTTDTLAADKLGVVRMTVTRDLAVTLKDSAGDNAMDDANNAVRVNIIAGAGSGGTAAPDNSAFTGGTTNVTPMGALYDTTPPAVTDGNVGAPRMTSSRVLMVDGSATTQPVSGPLTDAQLRATPVPISGTITANVGTGTQPISGVVSGTGTFTVTGSSADDQSYTAGLTIGDVVMGARDDTSPGVVGEDHVGIARITTNRAFHVNLRNESGTEEGVAANPLVINLTQLGGTALSGANVVDAGNTAFRVNCVTGCTAGGSFADASAFTFGTTAVGNTAFVVDDTATNTVSENSAGAGRMSTTRIPYFSLHTDAGVALLGQQTMAASIPVALASNQSALAVTGTFWQATQPVSGTFWQATQPVSGTFWPTTAGAPLSGRLSDGAAFYDAAKTGQLPTALVGGRLDTNLGAIAGTATVTGGVAGSLGVGGLAASGAAKAGNPQQVGHVFNTTQPTVTTGQVVEAQATARGALIVATGVDAFTVAGTVTTTPPSNASTNVAQFGGNAVASGTGAGGVGIPRVTISNDSSLAANQSVNVAQIAGATTSTAASGVQKVGIVGNAGAAVDAASGAAPPANRLAVAGLASGATSGLLLSMTVCDSFANVTVSTATTTLIVTGVSGRHVRICSLSLVTAAANNVALISGTGATCGTGTTGMNGGTTAATGWNFAANGGLTQGSGIGEVNRTNATGDSVCIITSAATQLSGRLSYAIY